MVILLVPCFITWYNPTLRNWAWRLAVIGLARWIIVMLYIWPADFTVREFGESSSELEKILAIVVAFVTLLNAHIALHQMRSHLRSHQPIASSA
jgi:hypothetical protein